jgi:hypothetical protein
MHMTVRDLEKMVAATEEWVSSPEGKRAMEEARKRVDETTAFLSSERIVDGHTLQMPMSL